MRATLVIVLSICCFGSGCSTPPAPAPPPTPAKSQAISNPDPPKRRQSHRRTANEKKRRALEARLDRVITKFEEIPRIVIHGEDVAMINDELASLDAKIKAGGEREKIAALQADKERIEKFVAELRASTEPWLKAYREYEAERESIESELNKLKNGKRHR